MIELHLEQGSDEWLQARAGAITASRFKDARERVGGLNDQQRTYVEAIKAGKPEDAARALAGYKNKPSAEAITRALDGLRVDRPGATALSYANLIAMERVAGQPLDETFVTWQMRRGAELEPVARDLYMARTGRIVDPAGIVFTDDRQFGYSTDGCVFGEPGGVEIKTPAACDKVAGVWIDPDPIIAEYMDQIHGGLWITGWHWIDLVVYTPWLAPVGKDLFIKRIHRDDNAIESLESDLMDFARMALAVEAVLREPMLEAA